MKTVSHTLHECKINCLLWNFKKCFDISYLQAIVFVCIMAIAYGHGYYGWPRKYAA